MDAVMEVALAIADFLEAGKPDEAAVLYRDRSIESRAAALSAAQTGIYDVQGRLGKTLLALRMFK